MSILDEPLERVARAVRETVEKNLLKEDSDVCVEYLWETVARDAAGGKEDGNRGVIRRFVMRQLRKTMEVMR